MAAGISRDYFKLEVVTEVTVTEEFVATLLYAAEGHYDSKCKHAGTGGLISKMKGWFNVLRDPMNPPCDGKELTATYALTMRDLDLLCKVTEPVIVQNAQQEKVLCAHLAIRKLFVEAQDESRRANAHITVE